MLPPKEFLKNIKPFSYLSEDELEFLVKNLRAEAFEEGETIVRGGEKAKKVYVIFSGSVSLYEDGTLVDVARRGDIIGLGIEGGKVRYTAVAREDTICYEIPKKAFDRLMESNENFRKFFESFVEGDFASVRKDNVLFEQFLYKPVRELLTKDPVVCSAVTSLREAVSEMEFNRVGSIVVVDEEKRPLGILTNADLRRFIVYGGNLEERVSAYMSRPPITVEANRPIFDAYVEFLRRGINHLIVTENGRVRGVITAKDVLSHFEPTASVIIYTRKLAKAGSTEELAAVYTNIKKAVAAMAVKGLHFYELTSIISDVYDLLTVRVIELEKRKFEKERGKLPEFLWVAMGSAGRKEQVIATDQDNAIVHEGEGREELLEFARSVNETLDRIGIPKCPANYMASNWNLSVEEWKGRFREWFKVLSAENIRKLTVFLDMRPVFGKFDLYEEIYEEIIESKNSQALRHLAYDAVALEPPHGILGIGKRVDIKKFGIYPITNGIRVLALENDILRVTNTKERIEKLREMEVLSGRVAKGLVSGYEFLQDLRLKIHAKEVLEGIETGNEIDTDKLDRLEHILLRETFKIILEFQKLLKGRYAIERGL